MTVGDLLRKASLVLFDFDGPLCDVFAGLPAPVVASRISDQCGVPRVSDDPLEVLRGAATLGAAKLRSVEDSLVAAEIEAVIVSTAERAGIALVRDLLKAGQRVGIVSNNSALAVLEFLSMHELSGQISPVIGRAYLSPGLMKPNPWPLLRALDANRSHPSDALFIGDSVSDLEAAAVAGIACIAIANKPGKAATFASFNVPVVASMSELLEHPR